MKPPFIGFFAATLLGSLLTISLQVNAQTIRDVSLSTSVAMFEYMRGNKSAAVIELSMSADAQPLSQGLYSRKLMYMNQIEQTFESSLAGGMPSNLHNAVWLDLFTLHNKEGACYEALNDLGELKYTAENDHEIRLMRVTCILNSSDMTKDLIADIEDIAVQAIGRSINLAYIYNNIASESHYNEDFKTAHYYYKKALSFLDDDDEAVSLRARIGLSLAWSYYEALLYDQALQQFSTLRLGSEWVDSSLLGYGWAAFKSGNPGLAIESWRQLIHLPFKSISVYEGYLAIPYAFESQNAYAEALLAYKKASALYVTTIEEIEQLSVAITAEDIRHHAIAYAISKGRAITPLHPLLVEAFALGHFQDVFDLNVELNAYKEKVDHFELTVNVLDEARVSRINQYGENQKEMLAGESAVEEKMQQLALKLDLLAEKVLALGMRASYVNKPLKSQYQHYLLLGKMLSEADVGDKAALEKKLKKMRRVLIGELDELMLEGGRGALLKDEHLIALAESYHLIEQRYQAYWAMKKHAKKVNVGEVQLLAMRERLAKARVNIANLQADIDEMLLIKTRYALALDKEQLEIYENQARIALARLSEEFYQQGGSKLWH